jgi:hypothetical protein
MILYCKCGEKWWQSPRSMRFYRPGQHWSMGYCGCGRQLSAGAGGTLSTDPPDRDEDEQCSNCDNQLDPNTDLVCPECGKQLVTLGRGVAYYGRPQPSTTVDCRPGGEVADARPGHRIELDESLTGDPNDPNGSQRR